MRVRVFCHTDGRPFWARALFTRSRSDDGACSAPRALRIADLRAGSSNSSTGSSIATKTQPALHDPRSVSQSVTDRNSFALLTIPELSPGYGQSPPGGSITGRGPDGGGS